MSGNQAEAIATEIEADASLDLLGYAGRRISGMPISCRIRNACTEWYIGAKKISRLYVVRLIKRATLPRTTGIPGPLPTQGDFFDPRFAAVKGPKSSLIKFQRPGWTTQGDWDAFVKAATRGSTYIVAFEVLPTLHGLSRYVRHLQQERKAEAMIAMVADAPIPEPVDEPDERTLLLGLSELELRQHAVYRAMGIVPWIWTEPRGTNIVLLNEHAKRFRSWQKGRAVEAVAKAAT